MNLLQILLLCPLTLLTLWFLGKNFFGGRKPNKTGSVQMCFIKLKGSQLINGYELMQVMNDQNFNFDKQHGVFNFEENGQITLRCLNLKKPGKFVEPFEESSVPGLMLVTDTNIDPENLPKRLEQMVEIAHVWQRNFGGHLVDQYNLPIEPNWVKHFLSQLNYNVGQGDLLKSC